MGREKWRKMNPRDKVVVWVVDKVVTIKKPREVLDWCAEADSETLEVPRHRRGITNLERKR